MPVFATLGCTKMTIAADSALIPIWFWRMKWKQIKWDYWHCSLCIKKFGFFFVFTVRNDSVLSCHTLCLLLLIKKTNIYIYISCFFCLFVFWVNTFLSRNTCTGGEWRPLQDRDRWGYTLQQTGPVHVTSMYIWSMESHVRLSSTQCIQVYVVLNVWF